MSSLRQRLTEKAWAADWPALPNTAGLPVPPKGWTAALNVAVDSKDARALFGVARLLRGETTPPIVQTVVHAQLDALDQWTARAGWWLTWPPTLEGFGRAIAKTHADPQPTVRQGLALILDAFPELAWASVQAMAPKYRELLPAAAQAAWFAPTPEAPTLAAEPAVTALPKAPVEKPTEPVPAPPPASLSERMRSPVPPAPVSAPAVPAAEPAPERAPRPERTARPTAITRWLSEQAVALRQEPSQPLQMQALDQALKRLQASTAQSHWFEEVLLPGLLALPPADLLELQDVWPPHARYVLADPVGLMKNSKFWAGLRDAGPVAQKMLSEDWLPRLVASDEWSPTDRIRMLRFMVAYVKTDRPLFEQRLGLWQAWGGQLNESAQLPHEHTAPDEGSAFSAPAVQSKSALQWLDEQGVPMWSEWAAQQRSASPPVSPRRSPRQRGP